MNIKKISAMAAALCMTSVMFASCGDTADSSSKSDSAAATTTTTTTAATTTTTAAPAADSTATADSATGGGDAAASDYTPVTEFEGYDAFLMFADGSWSWGNWNGQGYEGEAAFGIDADITGDGEYTVSVTRDSVMFPDADTGALGDAIILDPDTGEVCDATGTVVFCVDITGICDGTTNAKGEATKKNKLKEGDDANINKKTMGKYTGQEITCEVTSIKADGKDVEFDPTKIKYGNIEDDNNCYRIEIYNDYGDTAKDSPIDQTALAFANSIEVTFTIAGLDA